MMIYIGKINFALCSIAIAEFTKTLYPYHRISFIVNLSIKDNTSPIIKRGKFTIRIGIIFQFTTTVAQTIVTSYLYIPYLIF